MKNSGQKFYCTYGGPSMHPTLDAQDLLAIVPYAGRRRPELGDVILCNAPIAHGYVVHRIVARTRAGYKTRGDNCARTDSWLLPEAMIIGRVVAACRQTGQRPIHGGSVGRLRAMLCQLRRQARPALAGLLRPLTRSLCHLSPLPRDLRIYSFANRGRTDYRIMTGRKTVGVYDPAAHRWRLTLPYRLFMDETALPLPAHSHDPARQ